MSADPIRATRGTRRRGQIKRRLGGIFAASIAAEKSDSMRARVIANVGAAMALVLAEAAFEACAQGIENAAPSLGLDMPPAGVGGAGPAGPTSVGTGGSAETSVGGSGGVGLGAGGVSATGGSGPTGTGGSGGASAGSTGSGGTQDAGGGTAGSGGAGGAAGTNGGAAGVGGNGGAAGAAGAAGSGGNSGAAGRGGAAGSAGNGGSAGVGGNAGAAGTAGSAGNGGNAGAGGAGGVDAGVDAGVIDAAVDQNQPVHPVCAVGACKLVFVSSNAIDGNEGNVAAMDAVCQARAVARNLAGTWRAWASQTNNSVAMRFTQAAVPYRLLDGSTIANNWNDLIDGVLAHSINVLDDGTVAATALDVWTGTMITGGVAPFTCTDWTTNSPTVTGNIGRTNLADNGWTFFQDQFCNFSLRVYCFEQ